MSPETLAAIHVALLSIRDSGPIYPGCGICGNIIPNLLDEDDHTEEWAMLKHEIGCWLLKQFSSWPKYGEDNIFPIPNYYTDDDKWNNPLRLELLNWLIERIETGATE